MIFYRKDTYIMRKVSVEAIINCYINQEYMMNFIPRMLELIKPDCIDEVKKIMVNHKA